jgi:hypothetical protein
MVIFFVSLTTMIFLKVIATNFAKNGKIGYALIIAIPAIFLYPMIAVWIVNFLFGYQVDYWIAFLALMALKVFMYDGEVQEI